MSWQSLTDGVPSRIVDAFREADPVAYTPQTGAAFEVAAIFDDAYADIPVGEYAVESVAPRLHIAADDWSEATSVEEPQHGDTAVVAGDTYRVVGVQPDGNGMWTLILEAQ